MLSSNQIEHQLSLTLTSYVHPYPSDAPFLTYFGRGQIRIYGKTSRATEMDGESKKPCTMVHFT